MTGVLPAAPLKAFATFGRHMISSWDIDPVYPVLRQLIRDLDLGEREADWLTVLYLAYYELSSGVTAFLAHPDPAQASILSDEATLKLPTGIERRGLRQAHLMRIHLREWLERYDGESLFTGAKEVMLPTSGPAGRVLRTKLEFNNSVLSELFEGVRYNGRWAAYKGCEVMQKVRRYPVQAVDAGHQNSTGPREGLALFFPKLQGQSPTVIGALDRQTDVLIMCAAEHGTGLAVEECETLLCDFRSLTEGRYYVGHDTDLMLEGIGRAPQRTRDLLMHARRALPSEYRGELHGWDGRDREAMRAYVERGAILVRGEFGEFEEAA